MSFDPLPAASCLHRARIGKIAVAPLSASIAPKTEQEGAAVQYALAGIVGAAPPVGFKIGATGQRMQQYLGLSGPAAGFMEHGNLYAGSAVLRFDDYIRPGVECEVAVRLAHDLPVGGCTQAMAADAVGEFIAGIEIVDNRYGDLVELGTPSLIADQVFHCAAVVGVQGGIAWRSLDLGALQGRISVDGLERDRGTTGDLLGHPMNCLAWLANSSVARAFGGLKAGQLVMLGSVTPPVWLERSAQVTVEFAPLPPVTLTFR